MSIARDGKLVHYKAYGQLDATTGTPMPLVVDTLILSEFQSNCYVVRTDRTAAEAKARVTGFRESAPLALSGQPGTGCVGSLEAALLSKHCVNCTTAASTCCGGSPAALNCAVSCGVTAVACVFA